MHIGFFEMWIIKMSCSYLEHNHLEFKEVLLSWSHLEVNSVNDPEDEG